MLHAILFLAVASVSQPQASLRAPFPGPVGAGSIARITWTLDAAATRDIEEMELLLSLDGGRTFPIRITRDLSPESKSFSWRVPLLPTEHARLALRAGDSGVEEIELVSEEFAIAAVPAAPLEPTTLVAGEWRTGDALDGDPELPLSSNASLGGAPETIGSARQIPPADAPRPPLAALASLFRDGSAKASTNPQAKPLSLTLQRTPTAAPMRA